MHEKHRRRFGRHRADASRGGLPSRGVVEALPRNAALTRHGARKVRQPAIIDSHVHLALVFIAALVLAACDQMYDQVSVRPGESPQLLPSSGTVAVNATTPTTRAEVVSLRNPLQGGADALTSGALAYRRYCWPCHGPDHDGQSATVGPSFPRGNLNLLDPRVVRKSDGEYFRHITNGSEIAPPFAGAMTVDERWQVITYLRDVQAQKRQ